MNLPTFQSFTSAARAAFSSRFWAVDPARAADVASLHFGRGDRSAQVYEQLRSIAGAEASEAARVTKTKPAGGAIAVIPIYSFIVMHRTWLEDWGLVTSIETTRGRIREALADDAVSGILIDIDSPGGSTDGVEEMADEIFASGKKKNIIALSNSCAASAAYWLGVSANHLYCIPGSSVGSIGVWTMHEDVSKMYEEIGVDVTLISAGKYKTEGNPFEPLSDEGKAYAQQGVDAFYADFTKAVARGRHTTVAEVRGGMGEGRMVLADAAAKINMCCGVKTWDEVVREMQAAGAAPGKSKAKADLELDRTRTEAAIHRRRVQG